MGVFVLGLRFPHTDLWCVGNEDPSELTRDSLSIVSNNMNKVFCYLLFGMFFSGGLRFPGHLGIRFPGLRFQHTPFGRTNSKTPST